MVFFIVYFSIDSMRQIYAFYLALAAIWVVFALTEFWLFRGQILSGYRLTSYAVLTGTSFLPILLCLWRFHKKMETRFLIVFVLTVALMTPIISQTRGSLARVVLIIPLLWYLSRKHGIVLLAKKSYATPLVYFSLLFTAFLALIALGDLVITPLLGLGGRLSTVALASDQLASGGAAAGGNRIPEALAIAEKFSQAPWRLLTGYGLGSVYMLEGESRHFVHIGLVEVLFRTGIFGLIVFLWVHVAMARYALRRIRYNERFLLPAVIGILSLIGMVFLFGHPIVSTPIWTMPIFAGMLKLDTAGGRE
jgi:hypothetical protein